MAMPPRDDPAKAPESSWRSFALFGVGLALLAAALANLVMTEGGHGAFRWLMIAFVALLGLLGVGLAIDWRRLDGLTRAVQLAALVLGGVMIVAMAIIFPDVPRMLWQS
jgi:predicted membrane channel-forming protein YqfA (hemolysin III family)